MIITDVAVEYVVVGSAVVVVAASFETVVEELNVVVGHIQLFH